MENKKLSQDIQNKVQEYLARKSPRTEKELLDILFTEKILPKPGLKEKIHILQLDSWKQIKIITLFDPIWYFKYFFSFMKTWILAWLTGLKHIANDDPISLSNQDDELLKKLEDLDFEDVMKNKYNNPLIKTEIIEC